MPYKGNITIDCIIKYFIHNKPCFYKLFERHYNMCDVYLCEKLNYKNICLMLIKQIQMIKQMVKFLIKTLVLKNKLQYNIKIKK